MNTADFDSKFSALWTQTPQWLGRPPFQQAFIMSSVESGSVTLQLLSRIATGILFPQKYYSQNHRCSVEYHSCNEEHAPSLQTENEHGTLSNTTLTRLNSDINFGTKNHRSYLGYFSHLIESITSSFIQTNVPSLDTCLFEDEDRLDFIITQMDVSRMARHASRHLDVKSIYLLPTITYRANMETNVDMEAESSWLLVTPSGEEIIPCNYQQHLCVICLDVFQDGDQLRILPCHHSFHIGCIDRWLSGWNSDAECYTSGCPTCKKDPFLQSA
jgi:Ring finger domain